jgi:hypothetical protein
MIESGWGVYRVWNIKALWIGVGIETKRMHVDHWRWLNRSIKYGD